MRPLIQEHSPQDQFSNDAGADRQQGSGIALQNAERQMADEKNAGNKERRDITAVDQNAFFWAAVRDGGGARGMLV